MNRFAPTLLLVCLGAGGGLARAQEIPTTPPPKASPLPFESKMKLGDLSNRYLEGNWSDFSKDAMQLRDSIIDECNHPDDETRQLRRECPTSDDYVLLVWVGTVPGTTESTLLSALVHGRRPDGPFKPTLEPFTRTLPGLETGSESKLFEVFVSDNLSPSMASYYVSKPVSDPLLTQAPTVVERFAGPLMSAFQSVSARAIETGRIDGELSISAMVAGKKSPTGHVPNMAAVVRRVSLPTSRSSVEVSMAASLPFTSATLAQRVTDLEKELVEIAEPFDMVTVIHAAGEAIGDAAKRTECTTAEKMDACHTAMHSAVSMAFADARRSARNEWEDSTVQTVQTRMHGFIDALTPKRVAGKTALDNSPLTYVSFGVGAAYMVKPDPNDRAKIDKDTVTRDPLPHAMQMVLLNWSPWGYQDKTTRRWNGRAALRPFGAVVYQPNIGWAVGANFMPISSLGINFGWTRLYVPTPRGDLKFEAQLEEKQLLPGEEKGKGTGSYVLDEGLRRRPLELRGTGAYFIGISYNFH
jgi:hypothetical protein